MINKLIGLGTPRRFYHFCGKIIPWSLFLGCISILYSVLAGLFFVPADYLQGDGFRIIYIHVPCAILSLLIYVSMAINSAVFLVWRIKVADVLAYTAAPVGAFFTLCALITGSLWGKPMWGTWWIWDARLTSELILLFLYLGYIGLYQSISNQRRAAKACAILSLVGVVDIPIIHYSVYWWNTLHQGATISKLGQPAIHSSMITPLIVMLLGFGLYVIGIVCIRARTEILRRESNNQWVFSLLSKTA